MCFVVSDADACWTLLTGQNSLNIRTHGSLILKGECEDHSTRLTGGRGRAADESEGPCRLPISATSKRTHAEIRRGFHIIIQFSSFSCHHAAKLPQHGLRSAGFLADTVSTETVFFSNPILEWRECQASLSRGAQHHLRFEVRHLQTRNGFLGA